MFALFLMCTCHVLNSVIVITGFKYSSSVWFLKTSFRISDRGGGIPHKQMNKVFDYGFTTSGKEKEDSRMNRGLFGVVIENRAAGTMHG